MPMKTSRAAVLTLIAATVLLSTAMRAPAQPCPGDCNGDGSVTIGDLITGVNIALDRAPVGNCSSLDTNSDGKVTVSELIAAVHRALEGCGECASDLESGFAALARGDLRAAADAFGSAVAACPGDDRARFFAAMTQGTASVIDSSEGRDLAGRAGIVISGDSTDVCALDVTFPTETLPSSPRTGEYLDAIRRLVRPALEDVVSELGSLNAAATITVAVATLPECVRRHLDVDSVEIDRGDLLVARSGMETGLALIDLVDGYNSDASLHAILDETRQALFAAEPQLLTLRAADKVAAAADHFNAAADYMVQAIDAIRAEADDQSEDLLVIEEDDVDNARQARLGLTLFQQALRGEVSLPIDVVTGAVDLMDTGLGEHERLNLAKLFTGQLPNLREFLPPFNERGNFDTDRFPDPTFGGTVPDMTQNKIDNFLVGGPPCALCQSDDDCDPLGVGHFFCGYCFENCDDFETRRCSDDFLVCSDGTYG